MAAFGQSSKRYPDRETFSGRKEIGMKVTKPIGVIAASACLFGIGVAVGSSGHSAAATKYVPGPTVTDNVPGPTVTITAAPPKPRHASFTMPGDGTFLVGYKAGQWRPGTWQSPTPDSGNCYYETDSDLSGSINSIIANNNSAGPTVFTVSPNVYAVQVSGCNTFNKV